jgi:CRP-like cAMP-binding protein
MTTTPDGALATIRAISHNGNSRRYRAGEAIFRSGEQGDSLYGIVSGRVAVEWGDGRMRETLGPGSCFGVGALVDPEHRRYGNAVALSDAEVLVMNRKQFLFALQELPLFGLEMLQALDERLRHLKASALGQAADQPAGANTAA